MSDFNNADKPKESEASVKSRRDLLPNDEEKHWFDVCRSFLCYEGFLFQDLSNRQRHMNRLTNHQASLLPEISFSKMNKVGRAIKYNQDFFIDLVRHYMASTPYSGNSEDIDNRLPDKEDGPAIPYGQQHRNKAVLHSIAREWSSDGNTERLETFTIIIDRLKQILPVATDGSNNYKQRVLVPGCGVGRLPIEIASEGYATEGNEFSAFMLMAGNFVMNGIREANSYEICPWLDAVCNVVHVNDPMETARIPDTAAMDVLNSKGLFTDNSNGQDQLPFPKFAMASGDFVEVYGPGRDNGEQYDAIVTCFFVDTAPVVIDYIETIHHALKKGGVWVNFGPLLYHWHSDTENNGDDRYNQSIELSYEELKLVIEKVGFQLHKKEDYELNTQSHQRVTDIDEHSCMISCGYTANRNSLMNTNYNAILFSATKL